MPEKNAVLHRLDQLQEYWLGFTENKEACLLCWLLDADNRPMVEAFLACEQEEVGELHDLFLRFDVPFTDPTEHGFTLSKQLVETYEASSEELADVEGSGGWEAPPSDAGASDGEVFVRTCRSFYRHYAELMDHLAIVLTPNEVADPIAWQGWLLRLVNTPLPDALRFVVLDDAEAPALERLCAMEPERIATDYPELDMAGAIEEIARSANDGTPEGQFRASLATLNKAAGRRDLAKAEEAAEAALQVARRQQWLDMQATVYLSLGGLYLAMGDAAHALRAYRKSGGVAEEMESEAPARSTLRLQSKLSEGAVLFQEQRYAEAAATYEEAVPFAEAAENDVLNIEAWRMAGACYEKDDQIAEAWRANVRALEVGENLDEDQRSQSTLPYVGTALLQLANRPFYRDLRAVIEVRLAALLGDGWEEHLPEGLAA